MNDFAPYNIQHIQISDALSVAKAPYNQYVVFWFEQIPLGHLWLEATVQTDEKNIRQWIMEAIKPSVQHYIAGENNQWENNFKQGDVQPLLYALETSTIIKTFSKPHAPVSLSVVICTRNRTKALEQCIRTLLSSNDKDFELVIVDNAPDDDSTKELVQQFPNIVYVREPRKGLDIARNTGAQTASREVIAYTDDDVIIPPNWTANIKAAFTHAHIACVTGLVIPHELKAKWQWYFEKYWGFNKGYVPLVFDAAYFEKHKATGVPVWDVGAGANMAFRKSFFAKAGYFDERLDVGAAGCSGDSEMWYRALAEGFQCHYYPHVFVYHQHRDSEASLYNQIFHYMRGQVASLLVQHERYGHKGNLHYLYKVLPKWYKDRLRNKVRGRKSANALTLFTEIKGYFSGLRFYRRHKNQRTYNG